MKIFGALYQKILMSKILDILLIHQLINKYLTCTSQLVGDMKRCSLNSISVSLRTAVIVKIINVAINVLKTSHTRCKRVLKHFKVLKIQMFEF